MFHRTLLFIGASLAAGISSASAATVNYRVVTTLPGLGHGPNTWTGVFTINDLSVSAIDSSNISSLTAVSGATTYNVSPIDFAGITPPDPEIGSTGVAYWGMLTVDGNTGLNVYSTDLYNLLNTGTGASWNDLVTTGTFNLGTYQMDHTQLYVDTVDVLTREGRHDHIFAWDRPRALHPRLGTRQSGLRRLLEISPPQSGLTLKSQCDSDAVGAGLMTGQLPLCDSKTVSIGSRFPRDSPHPTANL